VVKIIDDAGAKRKNSRSPKVDLAWAEAAVAAREEDIVAADQAIGDAEDALKTITDLAADPGAWELALVPITDPPDTVPAIAADAAVQEALDKRPDYQQAQIAITNQDILVFVRRNELKPKLDLVAGFGNSGLNSSWNRAEHDLGSLDYYQWTLGVTFEVPLGNRAARARYRRSRLERHQAHIYLQALERQINLEVRNAVRAVATGAKRLEAAGKSVEAEEKRLRAEEALWDGGKGEGDVEDLLDAQAGFAEAQRRHLRALIDLTSAVVWEDE